MKKGVSYIDVAISAGIFILYLLFIFVTLRPGIKEDISGEYLLQIISSGLNNKISMNISKYPLFINYHTENPIDPWDPNNEDVIVELKGFPFNWTENKTNILDKYYAPVIFNITRHDLNTLNLTLKTREIIFGIGEEKLNNTNDDYQQLKQKFNFPEDKDFIIIVYEGKSPNNIIYSYSKIIPTETEKHIFVLQWSDILIKKDGTTIPIIINIRT